MRWLALVLLLVLDGTVSPPSDGAEAPVLAFTRTIIKTPPHPAPPPEVPVPTVS